MGLDIGVVDTIKWAPAPSRDFGGRIMEYIGTEEPFLSLREIREVREEFYADKEASADAAERDAEFIGWCAQMWSERGMAEDDSMRVVFSY